MWWRLRLCRAKEVEKAKAMVLKTEDAISKVELKWSWRLSCARGSAGVDSCGGGGGFVR